MSEQKEKMSEQEKKLEKDSEMEIIRGSKILSLIEITEEDKKLLQKTDDTTEESKEEKMEQPNIQDKTEEKNEGNKANSLQGTQKQLQDKKKERERKTRDSNRDREETRTKRQQRLQNIIDKKRCATCKMNYKANQKDVTCARCYGWIWMEIIGKKLAEIEFKKENKEEERKKEREIMKAINALDGAIEKLKKSRG